MAIGNATIVNANNSVALGTNANVTRVGEVNVGAGTSGRGYNSTNYRVIGGVHDPIDSHDASTKGYVDNIVVNYAGLYNAGAPTTSTVAYYLGQFYYDTTNDDIYYCSNIDTTDPDNPVYTWTALPSGGGGGPTVVQTTGTSTTDVMSQNAVSSMIFADPGTDTKIKIGAGASVSAQNYNMAIGGNADANGVQSTAVGYNAKARANGIAVGYNAQAGTTSSQTSTVAIGESAYGGGNNGVAIGTSANIVNSYSTAIGSSARARSERSVAIGASAQVSNSPAMAYSVALGANAVTTRAGEVNIGTGSNNYGYNSTPYRVLGGVHDGQLPQDVATVSQINATIDAINTALSTSIPHIGASS